MFRFAFFIKSPSPTFMSKGVLIKAEYYQHTYGRNVQCQRVSVPPIFKKGGQGGFYTVSSAFQSEHISAN